MTRRRPKRRPPRRTGPVGFSYRDAIDVIRPEVAERVRRKKSTMAEKPEPARLADLIPNEIATVDMLVRRAQLEGLSDAEARERVMLEYPLLWSKAVAARQRLTPPADAGSTQQEPRK